MERERFSWGRAKSIVRESFSGFSRHNDPRLGAALAFYTLLSLSPLLLVVLAIIGAIFDPEEARQAITKQVGDLVGDEGGEAIKSLIASANKPYHGIISTI